MLTTVRCIVVNAAALLLMDIRKKFGENIKALRIQKKISQEKLAFKANLDRTYIPSIEKGERNVSIVVIEKIAKALDVPIASLFDETT